MVPGPTQVINPNGSSIGAAVFAGLTSVTDGPTDRPTVHATRSIRIGPIYVRSTAMRPNDTNISSEMVVKMIQKLINAVVLRRITAVNEQTKLLCLYAKLT